MLCHAIITYIAHKLNENHRIFACIYYFENMNRFVNKVALVTGSSAGIGAAIAKELVKYGVVVVGVARRIDKLQEVANELAADPEQYKGKFYPVEGDVSNEDAIRSSLKWVFDKLGSISILVNNAGLMEASYLTDVTSEMFDRSFDINVKAAVLLSKEVIKNMIENSVDGHVININSVSGHTIVDIEPNLYMLYTSSKHALRMISEGLRREMVTKKANIKVTNISPGRVLTEMTREFGIPPENEKSILYPEDLASACISVLNTPPHVLISELTVTPLHRK